MSSRTSKQLAGKVCIVTGATRGIGKGIALQLGQAGGTIYVTGRTLKSSSAVQGSLEETVKEIEERGGRAIPVVCDHTKDEDVEKLFKRVSSEQNGQLDILVNNAYSAVNAVVEWIFVPFWKYPDNAWDQCNAVGLRNHYICTVLAARMMVPRKQGLIVNVSSTGGLTYLFNAPYGIGKAALDRMAVDCGKDLKDQNVAYISLWPGPAKTEQVLAMTSSLKGNEPQQFFKKGIEEGAETTEYSGLAIVHLATDPNIMKKSGRVWITADLGDEYGYTDIDGSRPWNPRSVRVLLIRTGSWLSPIIPMWIKVPKWLFSVFGSQF